jgi:hypothetical protein
VPLFFYVLRVALAHLAAGVPLVRCSEASSRRLVLSYL